MGIIAIVFGILAFILFIGIITLVTMLKAKNDEEDEEESDESLKEPESGSYQEKPKESRQIRQMYLKNLYMMKKERHMRKTENQVIVSRPALIFPICRRKQSRKTEISVL